MNVDKYLHIVLCLEDKTGDYCRHLAVVIVSVLENTESNICFHVFHDKTLLDENKLKLKDLVYAYKQKIQFHFIKSIFAGINLKGVKYLSIGTLYRLDIVDQLKGIEKAVYLDNDIIVTLDIKEMFKIDLQKHSIAGVYDIGVRKNSRLYTRYIPVDINNYFNAGVLIFNLDKISFQYNLIKQSKELLEKYPNDPFTDQSVLNHIFQSDCILLEERYNMIPNKESNIEEKCIWHFAGGYKPWQVRNFAVDKLYWKYFRKTPWGNNVDQLFYYYAQTVESLDRALLKYPTGSKKEFLKSVIIRLFIEIKEIKGKFFS